MNNTAIQMCLDVKQAHENLYKKLTALRELASNSPDMIELTDISYALHTCEKFVKDSSKEVRALKELIDKIVCAMWVQNGVHQPIRTEYVTGSPDVKVMAKIPTRRGDPENFKKLMTFLNVPEELWNMGDDEHLPINIHYPGMVDHISALATQGKPLPNGIDPSTTYPLYKLTLRPRKEIVKLAEES